MALKDYKRIINNKHTIEYVGNNKNHNTEILVGKTYEDFWIVLIDRKFKESFTTKLKALAYAKSYMRKH